MKKVKCISCGADIYYSPKDSELVCDVCGTRMPVPSESGKMAGEDMVLRRHLLVANESHDIKAYLEAVKYAYNTYLKRLFEDKESSQEAISGAISNMLADYARLAKNFYEYFTKALQKNKDELMKFLDESLEDDDSEAKQNNQMRRAGIEQDVKANEKSRCVVMPEYLTLCNQVLKYFPDVHDWYSYFNEILKDDIFTNIRDMALAKSLVGGGERPVKFDNAPVSSQVLESEYMQDVFKDTEEEKKRNEFAQEIDDLSDRVRGSRFKGSVVAWVMRFLAAVLVVVTFILFNKADKIENYDKNNNGYEETIEKYREIIEDESTDQQRRSECEDEIAKMKVSLAQYDWEVEILRKVGAYLMIGTVALIILSIPASIIKKRKLAKLGIK